MVSSAFSALIGQKQAVELLTQAIRRDRIAPAYLFVGPSGVGRSLAARCWIRDLFSTHLSGSDAKQAEPVDLLAKRLRQGNHPDLFWVEPTYLHQGQTISVAEAAARGIKRKAPPQIRLEQIRAVTQFLARRPLEAPRSIVVLEQAETMAEAAANGLLKTLEEPGQASLILIAPAIDSLLPTLVSRCQRIPFRRLSSDAIAQVLQQTEQAEILAHPEILELAQGSPGAAILHWQQFQNIPSELLQAITHPLPSLQTALELAQQIDRELDTAAQLWLVDYLQHCFWQQYLQGTIHQPPLQNLEKARKALLSYTQPRLVWEVTLMDILRLSCPRN